MRSLDGRYYRGEEKENSFREKFERYIRKDPLSPDRKRMAYVAVTAKMARVVYGIIKSGTSTAASMKWRRQLE